MQNKLVSSGQNIWDVALQEFGDIEQVFTFIADNDLNLNFKLKPSQNIIINNSGIGNNDIKNLFKFSKIILNNDQTEAMPPNIGGDYNNDYNNDYN
jgi:hypothetical protein